MCEIDHKLHAIVADKKRSVLQSIQEETATNIYLPSPLQGLVGPELSNGVSSSGASRNVIWITGEFFGVQRARDMVCQVAANKVPINRISYFLESDSLRRQSHSFRGTLQFCHASWTGW